MISEKCKKTLVKHFADGLDKFTKEEFTNYKFEVKYLEGDRPLISTERVLSNEEVI